MTDHDNLQAKPPADFGEHTRRHALKIAAQEAKRFVKYQNVSGSWPSQAPHGDAEGEGGDVNGPSPTRIDRLELLTVTLKEYIGFGLITSLNKHETQ